MPELVRQAIDPQHRLRSEPFAVWVGGPDDGKAKDLTVEVLKHGHLHRQEYVRDGHGIRPVKYIYPIREVYDETGQRGWRLYYLERHRSQ